MINVGDIVVYVGKSDWRWPEDIRDGVVIHILTGVSKKFVVRPWNTNKQLFMRESELRKIYPNRLRNTPKTINKQIIPEGIRSGDENYYRTEKPNSKKWDTFVGWKERGRYVRGGEKHRIRYNGECYFKKDQTCVKSEPSLCDWAESNYSREMRDYYLSPEYERNGGFQGTGWTREESDTPPAYQDEAYYGVSMGMPFSSGDEDECPHSVM